MTKWKSISEQIREYHNTYGWSEKDSENAFQVHDRRCQKTADYLLKDLAVRSMGMTPDSANDDRLDQVSFSDLEEIA